MRKVSKYGVFSCQYVHQKNSVFGHSSRSARYRYPFHPDNPRHRGKKPFQAQQRDPKIKI